MNKLTYGICGFILCVGIAWADDFKPSVKNKKFLQMGYGTPVAENLPKDIIRMQKQVPGIDAVIVGVKMRGKQEAFSGRPVWDGRFAWVGFGPGKVSWDNVKDDAAALKKATEKSNMELFVRYCSIPGSVDWFDEGEYEAILNNAKILGRLVREGGLAGVFFDIEEYGKKKYGQGRPYSYAYQKHANEHTIDEYVAQARKCGKKWIEAFQSEAPEKTNIIFSWAHSYYARQYWLRTCGKPDWNNVPSPSADGSLLGAFIDGILEGVNDGITLHDGIEHAYPGRTKEDFRTAREWVTMGEKFSAVPELYRKKMKVAIAIAWDIAGPRGGRHVFDANKPSANFRTPEEMAIAIRYALMYSDQYAWVYSQEVRWWEDPQKNLSPKYLESLTQAREDKPFGVDPNSEEFTVLKYYVPENRQNSYNIPSAEKARGGQTIKQHFAPLWKKYDLVMSLPVQAKFKTDPFSKGRSKSYQRPGFDDSDWKTINTDEFWENQGFKTYDGWAWYRLTFTVPKTLPENKKLYLAFGAVDEFAGVFINGDYVGNTTGEWNQISMVDVTKYIKAGQKCSLVAQVFGGAGAGGIWIPIKLVAEK